MDKNQPCRIILADDHTLFRNGLRTLLENTEGFSVVGEASDGEELLAMLPLCEADVVLLDIEMPRMNGIRAAGELLERYPELPIITLSMFGDEDYYFKMVSLGVKGFILKNSEIKEVVTAIETVMAGGSYFSQELLFTLVNNLKSTPTPLSDESGEELSGRESEILLHICRGESNSQIADALFISKRTVDKHRANILAKTGCKNTANLVVYAIKNNLVQISPEPVTNKRGAPYGAPLYAYPASRIRTSHPGKE